MSLTSPAFVRCAIALSVISLGMASCAGQPETPSSPSRDIPIPGVNNVTNEYWVTLADETPAAPPVAPVPTLGPGGNPGAWPPGPPPTPAPGAPVPSPPNSYHRLTLLIDEPVLYSGKPITDVLGCRNLPHTWYYDQLLHNETDVVVELMERENFFDGRFTSRNTQKINVGKYDTVIVHTRWCSGYPTFHYTQTRFKGRDNNGEPVVLSGPWVRLYARGTTR